MDQLVLKRAAASRLSGEWSDDDYHVLAEDTVVGRIMKAAASPVGTPRRARLQWRRSLRAGGGNRPLVRPLAPRSGGSRTAGNSLLPFCYPTR